jgi:predicted nucleotidyltransferase/HEPN domain-containing protein
MRSDLEHLPATKRRELEIAIRILMTEFEDALAGRNAPHRKAGRILKIVLFGSYARGDWVDDPAGGYFSDYDLLVVVNHDELTDVMEYWAQAEDHLVREQAITGAIGTPVNFIVHSLADVNAQLRRGRPFFIDVVRDGIALYEAPNHPFDRPRNPSPEETVSEARANYLHWFTSAQEFLLLARLARREGLSNKAAFLLHQASEHFYHCTLLVLTLYSPKSHKLNRLRSLAEEIAPALIAAWPRDTRFTQRAFELLRRAYVEARYSTNYAITGEELDWLEERLTMLDALVADVCRPRLGLG